MKLLPRRPVARGIVFGVSDAENNATRDRHTGAAAASLTVVGWDQNNATLLCKIITMPERSDNFKANFNFDSDSAQQKI